LIRGRGYGYIREASPLFDSPWSEYRAFKRGVSPSFQNLPPLLDKERGTQVEDSSRGEVT